MKSVEEQLENERQNYIINQRKKNFSEAVILTAWKEAVMIGDSIEEKLSRAQRLTASVGIKESVEIRESRIDRKNGSNREIITEVSTSVDLTKEVERMKRSYGMTAAETIFMLKPRVDSYGLSESQIRESWTPYADILSKSEIDGLVSRRVAGPKK
jgi:hypothetical protein